MLLACAQGAALLMLALSVWLLGELRFLAPYKVVLVRAYLTPLLIFGALVYLNLVALLYVLARHLTRSHMGEQLQHVERALQLPTHTVNRGLTDRLRL